MSINMQVDPDELASNYIELTNDLAYAQTFYPDSKVRSYLNELAVTAHQKSIKIARPLTINLNLLLTKRFLRQFGLYVGSFVTPY
ncbi:hypothetical protein KUH03_19970 [Sphingobacterium sp. E70]|uniref:hypothetical protein n=1 Tax=Sphingobacterium sp. E70 TaxID=2853439 RepID=UPI00211BF7B7|nr:hypothetical protein [Sphingobacterium sp. E70]ULT28587.1 hypothetical protein KUH03_19970 [Sphingobacterium sp. E70]